MLVVLDVAVDVLEWMHPLDVEYGVIDEWVFLVEMMVMVEDELFVMVLDQVVVLFVLCLILDL
jgi:hypothetical protein